MRTYLECIPCFLRQALEAAKLADADDETQKKILDEVAVRLPGFSLNVTPPEIARTVYGIVEERTGGVDAYKKIKEKSNKMAMELYPRLKKVVEGSRDVLLSAVRLAVAGNVIDYGVPRSFDIEKEIEECLEKDFAVFDFSEFSAAVEKAENILYILDNAGEIVFDRILIEEMKKDVVCAVRGKPIINDVTMEDARQVGLDDVARVISSGSVVPGTVVKDCSEEFLEYYEKADLVISKGQGNFETLADEDRDIFFIFKAKCEVIARHIGCGVGDIILKKI
ncbi:MAG: ARMT1-like domain-containing protein [Candidatus Omnitrophota bacterium]|nr:ARMT1-like domain-containing protein [Candidatus Omnitrophota bacterium]